MSCRVQSRPCPEPVVGAPVARGHYLSFEARFLDFVRLGRTPLGMTKRGERFARNDRAGSALGMTRRGCAALRLGRAPLGMTKRVCTALSMTERERTALGMTEGGMRCALAVPQTGMTKAVHQRLSTAHFQIRHAFLNIQYLHGTPYGGTRNIEYRSVTLYAKRHPLYVIKHLHFRR